MLKQNIKCNIVCCLFKTKNQVKNILKKYNNEEMNAYEIFTSNACIFSYGNDNNFNVCLCLNDLSNQLKIRKAIQHELIHWMQVSLNSETNKTYGIFNDVKFNLTNKQLKVLSSITGLDENDFKKEFEYLLNGNEFEAWVANACEDFEILNLSLNEFKKIIESDNNFNMIYLTCKDEVDLQELLLFGRLCYLSSLNNKNDDRYWYLIEAIKENMELNKNV